MKDHSKLKEILTELKRKGCTNVEVQFSGEGDDGAIQDIDFTPADPAFDLKRGELEDAAYGYLDDHVAIDWVNNDGGGGTLDIDLSGDGIKMKLNAYSNMNTTVDEPTHRETL